MAENPLVVLFPFLDRLGRTVSGVKVVPADGGGQDIVGQDGPGFGQYCDSVLLPVELELLDGLLAQFRAHFEVLGLDESVLGEHDMIRGDGQLLVARGDLDELVLGLVAH